MKRALLVATLTTVLAGCAGPLSLTLMPRDSGTVYSGELQSSGFDTGVLSVTLGDTKCSGPAVTVGSNESVGFINWFGVNRRGGMTNAVGTVNSSGDTALKAILTCSNGKGFRCDLSGRGSMGGGICMDDAGHVFDVIATRKP